MRTNDDFENVAMDIYQVFDDVINSLENVDIALKDIRQGAISFPLNKQMIKVDKLGKMVDLRCYTFFLTVFQSYQDNGG